MGVCWPVCLALLQRTIGSGSKALTLVPLNAMCSKKWAAPLFSFVSYRLPASIQTPTVAVSPAWTNTGHQRGWRLLETGSSRELLGSTSWTISTTWN